jgi:hypothetical protein
VLSLKRCRELLGKDCELDDGDLEKLRVDLYLIANVAMDMFSGKTELPTITPEPKRMVRLKPQARRHLTGRKRVIPREIYCGRVH